MFKPQLLILICSLSYTSALLADIELDNHESNIEDLGLPLKSISNLQSLKKLPQLQEYQAPFVQELNNANKVRTLFVSTEDLPIVDIQLTFNAGSARDQSIAQGVSGVSNMAAKLMTEGTDQYTAKQIAGIFEGLGAQFTVNSYRDMFVVRLRVLSDPAKLNPAVNLMLHVLNHATFNNAGLNIILNNTKVGQKQVQENPNRLMGIRFYRAIYGQHPYAEPSVGTQGSIKKITPELLIQFKNKFLVTQNMNIALTGNLSSEQATKLSNLISSSLNQGIAAESLPEPKEKSNFDIQYIPFQSTQAHVMVGQLGITRSDPDRIALEVANQMFGGSGFNSILMKELRIKRGYTYGAYSTLTTTQARGLFNFSYSTQQQHLMDSIQVAHQALIDFVNKPIIKKQLEETKEGMLRSFPMTFSSNASINAQIAAIGFYKLPADYLNQYQKKLSDLKPLQVQSAIQKHLRADRLTFVIVANELNKNDLENMLNHHLDPTYKAKIQQQTLSSNAHPSVQKDNSQSQNSLKKPKQDDSDLTLSTQKHQNQSNSKINKIYGNQSDKPESTLPLDKINHDITHPPEPSQDTTVPETIQTDAPPST